MKRKKTELRTVVADSWAELRQKVEDARRTLGQQEDEELWFRGVTSNEHRLLPSLMRCFDKTPTPEDAHKLETDLFFEFLAKARTGNEAALDHWDVLFFDAALSCPHQAP
jgi:hypothetical protein